MIRSLLPQMLRKSEGNLIESFQSLTGWTVAGTIVADTEYYKYGNMGVKLTNPLGNIGVLEKGGYGTFLKGVNKIALLFYAHDRNKINNFRFYLSSFSSFSKYYEKVINAAYNYFHQGWNYVVLNKDDFTTPNGENWDNISYFRVRFGANTGEVTSITLSALFTQPVLIPKVVISFDDAHKTVYEKAFPILENAGYKGVFYINSDFIGVTENDITLSQLQELYNAGWDISNHTKSHVNLLVTPHQEIINQVQGCTDWLIQNGFSRSAYHMSYPYGNYNDYIIGIMRDLKMLTIRTSDLRPVQFSQPYNLLSIPSKITLQNTTTIEQVKQAVDSIVQNGGNGMFYGHWIQDVPSNTYACSTSVFQYLVDYLKSRNVDVVTMSEWYDMLYSPRKKVERI